MFNPIISYATCVELVLFSLILDLEKQGTSMSVSIQNTIDHWKIVGFLFIYVLTK